MKRTVLQSIGLICGGLTITLQGCESFTRRGFHFRGTYLAPQSGYRIEMVAQGIRDIGEESIVDMHRLVQICPTQPKQGRSIRFRINSKREAQQAFLAIAHGTPQSWDWRSAQGILRSLLQQSGFTALEQVELAGAQRILESAPPVYPGQVAGLKVERADWNGNFSFNSAQPQTAWIADSDLPPCPILRPSPPSRQ
jgi:hypothetical protein